MQNEVDLATLYSQHSNTLLKRYTRAFSAANLDPAEDCLLIHSGCQHYYAGDDRGVPFQAYGHFLNWVPLNYPDQLILIRPEQRPVLLQYIPPDFWHDQRMNLESWWADQYDIKSVASFAELAQELGNFRLHYLGGELSRLSEQLAVTLVEAPLAMRQFLDYHRAYKSDYEIEILAQANHIALRGHQAARDSFLSGESEMGIHQAYLQACLVTEEQTPYTNIVGLDSNSAILHYQRKSTLPAPDSKVLLIDAGYRHRGYGSDITRTWTRSGIDSQFAAMVEGVTNIELKLVEQAQPGLNYADLHHSTLQQLAQLLIELELARGTADQLLELEIPQRFMPHGTGHLLGVQVHDVAGHQQDETGTLRPPPASSPALRMTRDLQDGMVVTIEPGCYFIPMLLEPLRDTDAGKRLDFAAIDRLTPLGGVRIEDNVLITESGSRNLTREKHRLASAA
jgi:Xaa-Pro dipeptidase